VCIQLSLTPHFFKISLNITFPSKSLKRYLTFRSDSNFVCISNFYMRVTYLALRIQLHSNNRHLVSSTNHGGPHMVPPSASFYCMLVAKVFLPTLCFQTPSACARFELLTAITMKSVLFCVVTQSSSERARRFGGMEAICSSETSNSIRTTRSCNQKGHNIQPSI
jgi:hypothetical protein